MSSMQHVPGSHLPVNISLADATIRSASPDTEKVEATLKNKHFEPQHLRIVTFHGEGRSLFYVVNTSASEDDQPAIVETFLTREEAERICRGGNSSYQRDQSGDNDANKAKNNA
ncbi:MAG: hypothetical protein L0Z50_37090 [Verrucomicrobiales bacterium]|nr:hypothetical protein [Verrucomicrobiales bacterium]